MTGVVLLALALGGVEKVVVVEALVQGESSQPSIGAELVKGLGGSPGSEVSAQLAQQLPTVAKAARAEPVIEAGQLLERGRDAYLEGKFPAAVDQLQRARDVLQQAIESFEEERKATETLFRAHMYLAFTLRSQGGDNMPRAVDAMKDAIRTFPGFEPAYSEFGPENVKFWREVKRQMDSAPMGRLRVRAAGEQASVYLNGRLVGVTPLELERVYPGRYLLHLRQAGEPTRLRTVEIKPGDNDVRLDPGFDRALRTEGGETSLVYADAATRRAQHVRHAAELARTLGVPAVLVYWLQGGNVHLAFVRSDGSARRLDTGLPEAGKVAADLRDEKAGEYVRGEVAPQRRVWTWVAAGAAVAALGTGIILGASSHSDFDDLNKKYPNGIVTDPRDLDTRDGASAKQTAANVLFGVAGAAAITSVVLYCYEGKTPISERAGLSPIVGPTFAGAEWKVRF